MRNPLKSLLAWLHAGVYGRNTECAAVNALVAETKRDPQFETVTVPVDVKIQVGTLNVKFADGTIFSYDVEGDARWERHYFHRELYEGWLSVTDLTDRVRDFIDNIDREGLISNQDGTHTKPAEGITDIYLENIRPYIIQVTTYERREVLALPEAA